MSSPTPRTPTAARTAIDREIMSSGRTSRISNAALSEVSYRGHHKQRGKGKLFLRVTFLAALMTWISIATLWSLELRVGLRQSNSDSDEDNFYHGDEHSLVGTAGREGGQLQQRRADVAMNSDVAASNGYILPTYSEELAAEAIRHSSFRCGDNPPTTAAANSTTLFAFIHVYKAAGTTLRQFFAEYCYACRKTWLSLGKCTSASPQSIRSSGMWKPCFIEEVADGRRHFREHYFLSSNKYFKPSKEGKRSYNKVTNAILERRVDIYGGHVRIGSGDYVHRHSNSSLSSVRYIVFLREPFDRYVSGVLYQNKVKQRHETLDEVCDKIKQRVRDSRENDQYWEKSLHYLLSPEQQFMLDGSIVNATTDFVALLKEEFNRRGQQLPYSQSLPQFTSNYSESAYIAEAKALMAIYNLRNYNAIIGMTERMKESMDILRHILFHQPEEEVKETVQQIFTAFTPMQRKTTFNHNSSSLWDQGQVNEDGGEKGVQANKSHKGDVSTEAVMQELYKDEEFMMLFRDYVKYERMITDYAWKMHTLQYEAVMKMSQ